MDFKSDIEKIKNEARLHFKDAKPSHGWDHTERVLHTAIHIGKIEGADLNVLELAAILHDIGRHKQDESLGALCHAAEGGKMAKEILNKYEIESEVIENVTHCIENHRFRGESRPESLEAKILFDADKLDAIGAVGIGRAFLFSGEVGAKLDNDTSTDVSKTDAYGPEDTAFREFTVKLAKVKDRMLTEEGKRLAQNRHIFMEQFFERFHAEAKGET